MRIAAKPVLGTVAVFAALALVWKVFTFTPLYLDLALSMRANDNPNEINVLLSDRNNRRGIWALDLPKGLYRDVNRPSFNEVFVGWFKGKPFRIPTYDEMRIYLELETLQFVSAADALEKSKSGSVLELNLQGEYWPYGKPPLWSRMKPTSSDPKRFGEEVELQKGVKISRVDPAVLEAEIQSNPLCKKKLFDCSSLKVDEWIVWISGTSGSTIGIVSCGQKQRMSLRLGPTCRGEFVFPNNRHVWFNSPNMQPEKVSALYERIKNRLEQLTVYLN